MPPRKQPKDGKNSQAVKALRRFLRRYVLRCAALSLLRAEASKKRKARLTKLVETTVFPGGVVRKKPPKRRAPNPDPFEPTPVPPHVLQECPGMTMEEAQRLWAQNGV